MRGGSCTCELSAAWRAACCTLLLAGGCRPNHAGSTAPPPTVAARQPQIFIADWANHRVVRVTGLHGEDWTTCGESGPVDLRYPVGICLDSSGRLYVAEQEPRLHRLDQLYGAGWVTHQLEPEPNRPPNRHLGCWVCLDRSGRIYVSDGGRHRIVRIDDMSGAGRVSLGSAGSGERQFHHPAGVWVDSQDRLYVADFDNFRIVRCNDMQGTNWTELGRYGSGEREFINPAGICIDSQGRIYVADQGNDRVVRIDDMRGANWTTVGSFGIGDAPQRLYAPTGIAVDRAGRIYVTQCSSNHRLVRMDDMSGANWTVFGGGGVGSGQFASPLGVFVRE
ncbi:MAG TPA: NHL repeat-containing protein [Pirellulaceae bacterium]|nr:NHL repeat-containing protein [Pirellulaceae bacterium]